MGIQPQSGVKSMFANWNKKKKGFSLGHEPSQAERDYQSAVASQAFETGEDYLIFPKAVLLPVTTRGSGVPGMERPWKRLNAEVFYQGLPMIYSLSLRREPPDAMKSGLRARRTLMEGALTALAMKTGRRPSAAENMTDHAMEQAESALTLGSPIYKGTLLAALFASPERFEDAESARRLLEAGLRTRGLLAQRLYYIAERTLLYLQPGGDLFPKLDEPLLFPNEALPLIPPPSRRVMPAKDSVWLGKHQRDGRDVHFSFTKGMDPTLPPPPHAITLILGEMGSGKTTLMRWIMMQRLLQGRTILSIDPEGENNVLCNAVGGKVIPAGIPDDPETCLLHPLEGDNPADLLLAARFLLAALAGEAILTPGVQAALHEAVQQYWKQFPGRRMTIANLVDALAAINSPDIGTPMAILRPYQKGGLFEGFFDRPKALLSMDFQKGEWYNFDLSTLREENRNIVHAVLAWFLYHIVTVGKNPMDIFIDEGWRLLRSGPFSDLLDELGRRARKRGIGVTLITHLPQDLAKNPTSMSMASTALIGRMGPDEAFAFFRSMGVPEAEARNHAENVSRLAPRVFMASPSGGRGALFPVQITLPVTWLRFWESLGDTMGFQEAGK
jgi:hypothetical protein